MANTYYLNKGNNSSVKGSILTKLIGYKESMVLIICTKDELNLKIRYWDMVTDGRTDDAKTISLRLCRRITSMSDLWSATKKFKSEAGAF